MKTGLMILCKKYRDSKNRFLDIAFRWKCASQDHIVSRILKSLQHNKFYCSDLYKLGNKLIVKKQGKRIRENPNFEYFINRVFQVPFRDLGLPIYPGLKFLFIIGFLLNVDEPLISSSVISSTSSNYTFPPTTYS